MNNVHIWQIFSEKRTFGWIEMVTRPGNPFRMEDIENFKWTSKVFKFYILYIFSVKCAVSFFAKKMICGYVTPLYIYLFNFLNLVFLVLTFVFKSLYLCFWPGFPLKLLIEACTTLPNSPSPRVSWSEESDVIYVQHLIN